MTPWTVAHQVRLSMGILQARILEWVAMPSSMGSSQPKDQTQVSHIVGGSFTVWATREAKEYWDLYLDLKPHWCRVKQNIRVDLLNLKIGICDHLRKK